MVFKALNSKGNLVAVKQIKLKNNDEGISPNALREISALKDLKNHPNLVRYV